MRAFIHLYNWFQAALKPVDPEEVDAHKKDYGPPLGNFEIVVYKRPLFNGDSLCFAVVKEGREFPSKGRGQKDIVVIRRYSVAL